MLICQESFGQRVFLGISRALIDIVGWAGACRQPFVSLEKGVAYFSAV